MIVDYGDYSMPLDDDKADGEEEEENYENDEFEEDNE